TYSIPILFFFFSSRRRHTISKRDWSSDVCSSDLGTLEHLLVPRGGEGRLGRRYHDKLSANWPYKKRQRPKNRKNDCIDETVFNGHPPSCVNLLSFGRRSDSL